MRSSAQKIKLADSIAKIVISTVGIGTIFSILAILLVIFMEFLPLFYKPDVDEISKIQTPVINQSQVLATGMGVYFEKAFTLRNNAELEFYDLKTKEQIEKVNLHEKFGQSQIKSVETSLNGDLSILCENGHVYQLKVKFSPFFPKDSTRIIRHDWKITAHASMGNKNYTHSSIRVSEEGRKIFIARTIDGELDIKQITMSESLFGDAEEEVTSQTLKTASKTKSFCIDQEGRYVYALTEDQHIYRWDMNSPGQARLIDKFLLGDGQKTPLSMNILIGDQELVIGYSNGSVDVLSPLQLKNTPKKIMKPIHSLQLSGQAIVDLIPSPRDRTIFIKDAKNHVHLVYSTNERNLMNFSYDKPITAMSISRRGKGWIGVLEDGQLIATKIKSDHPEINMKALFGAVHYAGFSEPDYVWQSSSGSDDFESKLSLVPLIFGTLKGALYAMIFSIPISVLAALYTSQFAGNRLRSIIKPIVEIMAAVPSVVIGFLAALWLAPILNDNLLYFIVIFLTLPTLTLFLLFFPIQQKKLSKGNGLEFFKMIPLLVVVFLCLHPLTQFIESNWFDGNFLEWFISFLGGDYDMRNSVIISLALGFTVIPIIFTMSEDAFSNVPKSLGTASLALGATPWQTAWKIILPAASPGVFAGIILGLGRAVGETMIVLMATGNTAIMDVSIFNGMRALSANIAVEIPEAPVGGSLYRVLFLSAAMLLVFTSILNTGTEIIRNRLRKTYSKF